MGFHVWHIWMNEWMKISQMYLYHYHFCRDHCLPHDNDSIKVCWCHYETMLCINTHHLGCIYTVRSTQSWVPNCLWKKNCFCSVYSQLIHCYIKSEWAERGIEYLLNNSYENLILLKVGQTFSNVYFGRMILFMYSIQQITKKNDRDLLTSLHLDNF